MIKTDYLLDAKGLACPMPIVRTKKAMNELTAGQVIEVHATDKGSTADIKAWSNSTGHSYLGTIEEADILKHYIRKSSSEELEEKTYPHIVSNEQLQKALDEEDVLLLDVRESAEFAFEHIPAAQSIPFGQLEESCKQLPKDAKIYVVCRTGNRSDMAARLLVEQGFQNVINVVPGMSEWNGATEKEIS